MSTEYVRPDLTQRYVLTRNVAGYKTIVAKAGTLETVAHVPGPGKVA